MTYIAAIGLRIRSQRNYIFAFAHSHIPPPSVASSVPVCVQLFTAVYRTHAAVPLYLHCLDDAIVAASQQQPHLPFQEPVLHPGQVVDIHGPACSGKTAVLSFVTMTSLIPHVWDLEVRNPIALIDNRGEPTLQTPTTVSVYLGGRNASVVYIDLDGRLSVRRIYRLIRRHLERRVVERRDELFAQSQAVLDPPTPEVYHSFTLQCLRNLHIFRPTCPVSFLATVQSLPTYFQTHASEHFAFVMIDSVSAFYWQDRAEDSPSSFTSISSAANLHARHITAHLIHLARRWACCVLTTSWNLTIFSSATLARPPSYPPELTYRPSSLPPAWARFADYRFVIARQNLQQYGAIASGTLEKLRDEENDIDEYSNGPHGAERNVAKRRGRAVMEGIVIGRLLVPIINEGQGANNAVGAMAEMMGGEVFEFGVTAEGIEDRV
ncbi:hypothetical protein BC937DRAFT_93082 [Endogone sp. FLAS-F59071]|nr:hypothetical protein BC937DRAFT_93082 [Endogone sp. FLAS-F59071]|eukprot:RUS23039.1 hypothetical protein BC937DRAFT_93082 [Endogone sp. FLAS-F59071]